MPAIPERDGETQPLMRGAGTIYIANDPKVWQWAIDMLGQHAINSDSSQVSRWVKDKLFSLLKSRRALRLFPLRELPPAWRDVDPRADLIIQGHGGAGIFFNPAEGQVTRLLPSSWQFMRARWIHSQAAVQQITPWVGNWNEAKLTFQETLVPGHTVPLNDLTRGLQVLKQLWPQMVSVHRTRTMHRRLRGASSRRYEAARNLFESIGLSDLWHAGHEAKVVHGLIHGDLKPQNIIIDGSRLVVIDWYESFSLAPPLVDVFYYLFWFARHHPPQHVVQAALADPGWLLSSLPGCLDDRTAHASLVSLVRESTRRLQSERQGERVITRLGVFAKEVAHILNLSSAR